MSNIFRIYRRRTVMKHKRNYFLILFLTVHASVNSLYLFSREAFSGRMRLYETANCYGNSSILAGADCLVHIVYAFILYIQDYKARSCQICRCKQVSIRWLGIQKHDYPWFAYSYWNRFAPYRFLGAKMQLQEFME